MSKRKRKFKKKITELLFQIIPVMIGVYLGLIASNWSQKKQQKEKTASLTENIMVEVKTNRDKIANVIAYHEKLRDSARYNLNTKNNKIPSFFRGIRVVTLPNSAHETGIQTGLLNEFPVEELQILNEAYTYQDSYNKFGNILLSSLFSMDLTDEELSKTKALQYLSIAMSDVVHKEKELLKAYDNILKDSLQFNN